MHKQESINDFLKSSRSIKKMHKLSLKDFLNSTEETS